MLPLKLHTGLTPNPTQTIRIRISALIIPVLQHTTSLTVDPSCVSLTFGCGYHWDPRSLMIAGMLKPQQGLAQSESQRPGKEAEIPGLQMYIDSS